MSKERRKHSREFMVEAVRMVTDKGLTVSQATRDLGIDRSLLARWKLELASDPAIISGAAAEKSIGITCAGTVPELRGPPASGDVSDDGDVTSGNLEKEPSWRASMLLAFREVSQLDAPGSW